MNNGAEYCLDACGTRRTVDGPVVVALIGDRDVRVGSRKRQDEPVGSSSHSSES